MPGLISHFRGGNLPLIECHILFPASGTAPSAAPPLLATALVDTGASHTVIAPHLLAALALPKQGDISHTVVGGTSRNCLTYVCDLQLKGLRSLPPHIDYVWTLNDLIVICDNLVGSDLILGWNALTFLDLHFGRDGAFLLRLP